MNKITIWDIFFIVAILAICASVIMYMEGLMVGKYVFIGAGVLYLICRSKSFYRGDDFRMKRLNRLYAFNMVLLICSVWFMYKDIDSWIIGLLIMALVELYVAFRSIRYQKESSKKDEE